MTTFVELVDRVTKLENIVTTLSGGTKPGSTGGIGGGGYAGGVTEGISSYEEYNDALASGGWDAQEMQDFMNQHKWDAIYGLDGSATLGTPKYGSSISNTFMARYYRTSNLWQMSAGGTNYNPNILEIFESGTTIPMTTQAAGLFQLGSLNNPTSWNSARQRVRAVNIDAGYGDTASFKDVFKEWHSTKYATVGWRTALSSTTQLISGISSMVRLANPNNEELNDAMAAVGLVASWATWGASVPYQMTMGVPGWISIGITGALMIVNTLTTGVSIGVNINDNYEDVITPSWGFSS